MEILKDYLNIPFIFVVIPNLGVMVTAYNLAQYLISKGTSLFDNRHNELVEWFICMESDKYYSVS